MKSALRQKDASMAKGMHAILRFQKHQGAMALIPADALEDICQMRRINREKMAEITGKGA